MKNTVTATVYIGWGQTPGVEDNINCGEHPTVEAAKAAVAARGLNLLEVETEYRERPIPYDTRLARATASGLNMAEVVRLINAARINGSEQSNLDMVPTNIGIVDYNQFRLSFATRAAAFCFQQYVSADSSSTAGAVVCDFEEDVDVTFDAIA